MIIPIPVPARFCNVVVGYRLLVLANSTATTQGARDARQFAILPPRWLDRAEKARVKAVSMKLTMPQRDELIAAYLADEPLKNIAAQFGVSQTYVYHLIRRPTQRVAVCTRVKIKQLKRMVERQNRLLATKQATLLEQIGNANSPSRRGSCLPRAVSRRRVQLCGL